MGSHDRLPTMLVHWMSMKSSRYNYVCRLIKHSAMLYMVHKIQHDVRGWDDLIQHNVKSSAISASRSKYLVFYFIHGTGIYVSSWPFMPTSPENLNLNRPKFHCFLQFIALYINMNASFKVFLFTFTALSFIRQCSQFTVLNEKNITLLDFDPTMHFSFTKMQQICYTNSVC